MLSPLYFDAMEATAPSKAVLQALNVSQAGNWQSIASLHQGGQRLLPVVEKALRSIYQFLGSSQEGVVLMTSCAAESVAQLFQSVYQEVTRSQGKNHFLVGALDEAPAILATSQLEALGCVTKTIPSSSGLITARSLAEAITPRTALVSLTAVHGLTGVIQPLEELVKVCRERGVLLHIEASHLLGKLYIDVEELGIDYLTAEGSLFHAPQGTALLWARAKAPLVPLFLGGYEQGALRPGPLSVPLLTALGVAAQEALESIDYMNMEVARLRDCFVQEVKKGWPAVEELFASYLRAPHLVALAFPAISAEALLFCLNQKGLYASMGGGRLQQMALFLETAGINPLTAQSAISFGISRLTSYDEVRLAASLVVEEATRLSKLSCGLKKMSLELLVQGFTWNRYSKKVVLAASQPQFGKLLSQEMAFERGLRLVESSAGSLAEGNLIHLYWYVNPEDGMIVEVGYQLFGHSALIAAAEAASELALWKHYDQIARMQADLLDRHLRDKADSPAFPVEAMQHIQIVMHALKSSSEQCRDLPLPDSYIAPPAPSGLGEVIEGGYPGFDELSLKARLEVIESTLDREVRPYIALDGGGIEVMDLTPDKEVKIIYKGNCTSCFSSTGATLSYIQQVLRAKVHPEITVVPEL